MRASRLAVVVIYVLISGVVGQARADGLPERAAPAPAPSYYAPPAFNWTGLYAGVYLGGAHSVWTIDFFRNNNHGHAELGGDGIAGGGWLGYNLQMNSNIVVGVEADLGFTNASQSNQTFDNDFTYSDYGAFGSLRGRLGYAFDRMLVYGTAGLAFANITNNIQKGRNAGVQVVSEDQSHTGYALGLGVEYAFDRNWVARAEYLYSNYGLTTLFNRDGNQADFENELHLVRAGLSYRF